MPSEPLVIGAFLDLYVGDAPPGSGVLTRISARRTDGTEMAHSLPREYEDVLDNWVQSGRKTVQVPFTFLGVDDDVMRLANGLSITASDPDGPTTNQKYTMLFVSPNPDAKESILIPVCATNTSWRMNRNKQRPTTMPISIVYTNRNAQKLFYYRDTLANLLAKSEMSGRNPF